MRNTIYCLQICYLFVVLISSASPAKDLQPLSLDDIFGESGYWQNESSGNKRVVWTPGGLELTVLEDAPNGSGVVEIARYQLPSLTRTVATNSDDLIPSGQSEPIDVQDYAWSPDGKHILIKTNSVELTTRWLGTSADYWLLNLQTKALRQLGNDSDPASLMDATFSPNGKHVAYVYQNNIYVENVRNGELTQLTHDGTEEVLNGIGDWANEAEFALLKGGRWTIDRRFKWSPDSKRIAYWQYDTGGVGTFYMIKNTDVAYPKIIPLKYPKAGTQNSATKIGVVSITTKKTTWFNLEGDSRNFYIPRMDWAANSEELLIQQMNRLQNESRVKFGDASSGNTKELFVESDRAWVEAYRENPIWLENGSHFIWLSERDGWRRPYLISRNGRQLKALTSGAFDVTSIVGVDEESDTLYFLASPTSPTQQALYRVSIFGSQALTRVTPDQFEGWHEYDASPRSKWARHTYSKFGVPPIEEIIELTNHQPVMTIIDNEKQVSRLEQTQRGPVEFDRVEIENGVLLDAWIMHPPSVNRSAKYPVLMYVYSEPMGQTVADRWYGSRYLWHLLLTQNGYVVASVDSRGANVARGRDWRKSVYGTVGVQASLDQSLALQALTQERPYMDKARIGVWGSSGGGSMTLNMLFRYPKAYRVGISVAPVANQLLYDTIYQERYMMTPQENPSGYTAGSPITYAQNLEGELLLVHGTADDNVHYQGTEQLIDKLIANNKQFSVMIYPDRSHSISEKENTQLHKYSLMTHFLNTHLGDTK